MFRKHEHKHNWEISKKGQFNNLGNFFCDTYFYCECGETKRERFITNFKEAGYTKEEYLNLVKKG